MVAERAHMSSSSPKTKTKRILIVDDEPDVISLFKMILEMNGYEVDAYNNPLEALSNFKPNSYGLALLDVRMAPLNGFELYKKMKNTDSRLKHVSSRHLKIIAKNSRNHFHN